ncbi:GNAT family N-acetyltransferase [uncultured Rossellomorea sp.]|uniref:GNAT family N-acetyltransferase n=1 Tax=uncultured Rossellomorea sp. TaxID=2837549 RepID=UPI002607FCF7|nr:GNAT family N-acetyltransferase [uncultured Rossellomorea sp.]
MNDKQVMSGIKEDIIISNFNTDDLNSFIQIHLEHLFSDSEFSKMYLVERFKYLLEYEKAVTVSAKDIHGEMLGLVYGGPEGYKSKMNKNIIKKIALKILGKPYLLFSGEFMYKYKSAINRLILKFRPRKTDAEFSSENADPVYIPPEPTLRLTGIAVLEEYSHLGIGEQLLIGYEKAAKEKNYRSIILETPRTNIRAIKFYEKFGWKNFVNDDANLGKVYFYKLIPENN